MSTEDDVIAKYRSDLRAEADLARGDLDEIEDHLRALYSELRERMPGGEAIAEACRRLGEPKQVAREHARVRTPFGARLSRLRAWSAAALLAPMAFQAVDSARHWGLASPAGIECALVLFVMMALVARLTWARPIIVGSLATTLAWNVAVTAVTPLAMPFGTLFLVSNVGALVFLVPWRRGELTPAAIGLALLAPAYSAAVASLWFYVNAPDGMVVVNPFGFLAALCVVLAGIGFVTRARWGAVTAAIAALSLVAVAHAFWPMTSRAPGGDVWRTLILGNFAFGAATAMAAAVVCWRTARSTFGTLRHVTT